MSLCDYVPLPKTTGKQFHPEYGTESLEKLEAKYWMGTNPNCYLEEEN